jgi:hypothetical protein
MTTQPSSLERAVLDHGGEPSFLGVATSAEQLDLLRDADGKLPQDVFRLVREGKVERGRGRPLNSRNKRNDDVARYYTQRFGDPLIAIGELANTPFDQLIELILVADSTAEREERLLRLIDSAEELIKSLMASIKAGALAAGDKLDQRIDKVATLLERVFDAAKALKMKPGDLAIKALNLQLAAHKVALEYVHSKKPVEANVNVRSDGVIVGLAPKPGASVEDKDALLRKAGEGIAKMLADGRVDPSRLGEYRFVDGQFVEGEFSEVVDDGGDA